MALGIDAAAHAGALEAGGPTIAVLAGGADVPYPREQARAAPRGSPRAGCVVSEMPPGSHAAALVLPGAQPDHRRRSRGVTVVVEARRALGLADHRRARAPTSGATSARCPGR